MRSSSSLLTLFWFFGTVFFAQFPSRSSGATQGTSYGWGRNSEGQLGLGTTGNVLTPTATTVLGSNVYQVSAGVYHSLGILGKKEKIISVLSKQNQRTLEEICSKELFTEKLTDIQICKSVAKDENVESKVLQIELIKMYINDQSVRGNVLSEIISKYKLDEYELTKVDAVSIDKMNRDRLKEIIIESGFPTRQLVGKDAMQGIFLMIQHSDGDKEWQKAQLPNCLLYTSPSPRD